MKKWLKQQFTEFTAWIGFFICLSSFFAPDWVTFCLGVALISIDDVTADKITSKLSPFASKKLDDWTGE